MCLIYLCKIFVIFVFDEGKSMSFLLYFTGGSKNHMSSFLLFAIHTLAQGYSLLCQICVYWISGWSTRIHIFCCHFLNLVFHSMLNQFSILFSSDSFSVPAIFNAGCTYWDIYQRSTLNRQAWLVLSKLKLCNVFSSHISHSRAKRKKNIMTYAYIYYFLSIKFHLADNH